MHLLRKPITTDKPIFSSERMLLKNCDHKGSVAKKKSLIVILKGLGVKTN
jgi:hypothetical protein